MIGEWQRLRGSNIGLTLVGSSSFCAKETLPWLCGVMIKVLFYFITFSLYFNQVDVMKGCKGTAVGKGLTFYVLTNC